VSKCGIVDQTEQRAEFLAQTTYEIGNLFCRGRRACIEIRRGGALRFRTSDRQVFAFLLRHRYDAKSKQQVFSLRQGSMCEAVIAEDTAERLVSLKKLSSLAGIR
jgi:hypothetical protein